MLILFIIKFN